MSITEEGLTVDRKAQIARQEFTGSMAAYTQTSQIFALMFQRWSF